MDSGSLWGKALMNKCARISGDNTLDWRKGDARMTETSAPIDLDGGGDPGATSEGGGDGMSVGRGQVGPDEPRKPDRKRCT